MNNVHCCRLNKDLEEHRKMQMVFSDKFNVAGTCNRRYYAHKKPGKFCNYYTVFSKINISIAELGEKWMLYITAKTAC
jgi:hypothetical protein